MTRSENADALPAQLPTAGFDLLSFVARVTARHKGLTATQVRICQAFVLNFGASRKELARLADCDETTVSKWVGNPEFWQIIGEFDLSGMQRSQALALISAKLSEMLERAGKLTADDGAWLDRVANWTGITRQLPQSVSVAVATSGGLTDRIASRAEELARGIQGELFKVSPKAATSNGETCRDNRVEDSILNPESPSTVGEIGVQGGEDRGGER
jgi:hypothetical protein